MSTFQQLDGQRRNRQGIISFKTLTFTVYKKILWYHSIPVKKFAILTNAVSSLFVWFVDDELPDASELFEPPDGLLGTCNVPERLRCLSSLPVDVVVLVDVQLFGTLTAQRLWKFWLQSSHFKPCLTKPNNISPQKSQNVGVRYECTDNAWGLTWFA